MTFRPDLTIVVPAHNCAHHIPSLMAQIGQIKEIDVEVIFVDDGSTDDTFAKITEAARTHPKVRVLRTTRNSGAGRARNLAIPEIAGRYTLFFDADDTLLVDAPQKGVRHLDRSGADLAVFPYFYDRGGTATHQGMLHPDAKIWEAASRGQYCTSGKISRFPRLLEFTNYPWNKIMRTERLHQTGIRFGESIVHNDIEAHWRMLIEAREIILVDTPVCRHIVHGTGNNLTNQRDRKRFAIFGALGQTYDYLCEDSKRREAYAQNFWAFALDTLDWAKQRVSPTLHLEFEHNVAALCARVDLIDYRTICGKNPRVADMMKASILRFREGRR